MSVSWEAFLAGRIHAADATTRTGGITGLERLRAVRELRHALDPASDPLWQLTAYPKHAASEGEIVMPPPVPRPKPKGPPSRFGKVPSKTDAKHDANVIKVSNRWGKTGVESTGKHAKPPKGGGKK